MDAAPEPDGSLEPPACPECGAPAIDGLDCWGQLGGVLAWEAEDPELLVEHFLTVACYNLQHPAQYTDEALAGLRESLIAYLEQGVTIAELRRRTSAVFDGPRRVRKPLAERRPALRRWRLTVADVYLPHPPAGAAARVRDWAAAVRAEL